MCPTSNHRDPQSSPFSERVDGRAVSLRALRALCISCWPRIEAHAAKILCALLWACGDCSRRSAEGRSRAAGGTPEADETVGLHAKNLGALVVLLTGDAGRSALREVCSALAALRPAAKAMQELADEARGVSSVMEAGAPRD